MLVLSRQRDETIMIGDDIEVTVVDIRGDKVRLGINAPKEVAVHRKEVYEAIRRENREAAQVKPEDLQGIKPPGADSKGEKGPKLPAKPGHPAPTNNPAAGPVAGSTPATGGKPGEGATAQNGGPDESTAAKP
jgi:carbon storage regulator